MNNLEKILLDEIINFYGLKEYDRIYGGIDFLYPIKKIFQSIANKYRYKYCQGKARPLRIGEIHPLCANFEGPGTEIKDLTVQNYPPYNDVDNCARNHDIAYLNSSNIKDQNLKQIAIREADHIFMNCIKPYSNEEPYYSLGQLILVKNKLEDFIPLLFKLLAPEYYGKEK